MQVKNTRYNILVVDDHQLIVNGIRMLLDDRINHFHFAHTIQGAAEQASFHQPDLAIIDFSLPDGTGDMLVRELRYRCPNTRVICYTFHADQCTISKMVDAGVHGYVTKSSDAQILRTAVDTVLDRREFFCEEAKSYLFNRIGENTERVMFRYGNDIVLNDREVAIIRLLCMGKTAKETSQEIFLSERTVEQYRNNIAKKLGTKNLIGMVKFALQNGIISQAEM
ncbi:response regulator [Taibaiella soli]|uniref:DNA-binding response regulator n=1 Tax=Taibaiella soli TaxID=1649169 RepID=A0A2W2AIA3_9BACT|nr:response regulator transcription factor [Taibaiella soli]PZF75011.1 hypothetical protein DN068_00205 [Taibaiella soli]